MKQITIPVLAFFLAVFDCARPVAAQQGQQQQDIAALIFHKDSLFWQAYNTCNVQGMDQYFTDDVEFYHDKGGITLGLPALLASIKNGMCSKPGYKLRREAVPGTVQVFPMYQNGTVYGAIISGEHFFYVTDGGKPEYRDGLAKFAQLWVLRNGEWKMSRVLSYDHGPASRADAKRK